MSQSKSAAAKSFNQAGNSMSMDLKASDPEVMLVRKLRRLENRVFNTIMAVVIVVLVVAPLALIYFSIISTDSGVTLWPILLWSASVLSVVVAMVAGSVYKRDLFALEAARM